MKIREKKGIKDIIKNHSFFEENVEDILQYSQEVIINIPKRKILKREKFLILESLILRVCALWEKFLEKEIILLVNLNPQKIIEEMELNKDSKLDLKLIRAILFSDIYRDFNDLNRSKTFFNKYIIDNLNPFNKISKSYMKKINFVYKLRNYLSHYSEFSKRKLFNSYKKEYNLKRFTEPGQFLISNNGKRFKELISSFKYVSITMKKLLKDLK